VIFNVLPYTLLTQMRFSVTFLSLIALTVVAQDTNIHTVEQAFDNAHVSD